MAPARSVTELLAPFRADPEGTAVFSDFDGTLSPIVDDPPAARPLPGVADVLARLARTYGRVGVISGRPAAFLQAHLGGRGLFLSGLYGMEVVDDEGGGIRAAADAEEWRPAVEKVASAADAGLPTGVSLERKGLAVTLHFRAHPSLEAAARAWADDQARATGLVVHPARMSYELPPPVERDKGTVLAGAACGRREVCFLGDDRGDLSAFDALDAMGARGMTTLKVGVSSGEAPDELLERADLVVDGPHGSLSVLRALLEDQGAR